MFDEHRLVRFWCWSGSWCRYGIFSRNFYHLQERGGSTNFADESRSCRRIFVKFFSGVERLAGNKPFDVGADTDHALYPGIF